MFCAVPGTIGRSRPATAESTTQGLPEAFPLPGWPGEPWSSPGLFLWNGGLSNGVGHESIFRPIAGIT